MAQLLSPCNARIIGLPENIIKKIGYDCKNKECELFQDVDDKLHIRTLDNKVSLVTSKAEIVAVTGNKICFKTESGNFYSFAI